MIEYTTDNETESRVREHSTDEANRDIDREILENIKTYGFSDMEAIEQRLEELDKEWDVERVLEVNASSLALLGTVLGFTRSKRWFILPVTVAAFLLQHGIQGWCPPLPVLRRLGFRTRKEIDEERFALKALRGDFTRVKKAQTAEVVLDAVRS